MLFRHKIHAMLMFFNFFCTAITDATNAGAASAGVSVIEVPSEARARHRRMRALRGLMRYGHFCIFSEVLGAHMANLSPIDF